MRILYVEDNPANLFLVQRIARMDNHEVINYANGETAINNFDRDKPDLVLMDLQLEGKMTGLDVVKALRAAGHQVPIIAVTAYAMMGDKERCLEAGCTAYIAKPIPVGDLVELIKRYGSKQPATKTATLEVVASANGKAAPPASAAETKPETAQEPAKDAAPVASTSPAVVPLKPDDAKESAKDAAPVVSIAEVAATEKGASPAETAPPPKPEAAQESAKETSPEIKVEPPATSVNTLVASESKTGETQSKTVEKSSSNEDATLPSRPASEGFKLMPETTEETTAQKASQ
jgi:CheY-like chemotaxis protein